MQKRAYIFFPAAHANPVYQGWMENLPLPHSIVRHYDTNWLPPDDAAIVITHNHYRWEELSILRRIVDEGRVPVLILADGILEYRNTFENPELADGAMFKPLMGHKLACIGRSQARWIESWGNPGKCEVVGVPRFDGVQPGVMPAPENREIESQHNRPFRLLVATASTPWFTDQQRDETTAALHDLATWLDAHPVLAGRPVEVTWRMSEALHGILGRGKWARKRGTFALALRGIDAVITTPSTVQLEAALYGLPVALLDYHNAPQLTPAAWTISAAEHFDSIMADLVSPSPARLFVQQALLNDALDFQTPAQPRMIALVTRMIAIAEECRDAGRPLAFPHRLIEDAQHGFSRVPETAELSHLFPGNAAFADDATERLQLELSQARAALGEYPEKFFEQRSANQHLRSYIQWLRLLVRNRAATINELSDLVNRLKANGSADGPSD